MRDFELGVARPEHGDLLVYMDGPMEGSVTEYTGADEFTVEYATGGNLASVSYRRAGWRLWKVGAPRE